MGGSRRSGASLPWVSFPGNRRVAALASMLAMVATFGQLTHPTTVRASVGDISTIAGTGSAGYTGDGGPATSAQLNQPVGVAADAAGNRYVADLGNAVVRKIDTSGVITTVAGTGTPGFSGDGGPATQAQLSQPFGLLFDSAGNLYIADQGTNVNNIRKVDTSGVITTIAGNGSLTPSPDGTPAAGAGIGQPQFMVITPAGFFFTDDVNNKVWKIDSGGILTTVASGIPGALGLTADGAGNLYVTAINGNVVDKIDTVGNVTVVAGTGAAGYSGDGGPAISAQLNGPYDVKAAGSDLYFSDWRNDVVRKVDLSGTISTVAGTGSPGYSGDGGPATSAQLFAPLGLAFAGGDLLIADFGNNAVRDVRSLGVDLVNLGESGPTTVSAGQAFTYTLTVTNPGTVGPATGVVLSDPLPGGLSFVSASTTQGTCTASGGVVTCSLGTLTPETAARVTVTVTAPSASTAVVNTATVTANEADPSPGNNTASVTTYVDAADLSVTGTASPDPVLAGQVQTFAMTVQNAGPSVATGVQLSNPLPPGVTLQSASATQGFCTSGGATVTCSLGTLSAGGSATVTIGLVPSLNVVGIADTATVSGNQVDQNPANNTATVQTSVVLGVATQFTNAENTPIDPGQEVPYPSAITAGADGNMWYGRLFPNFGEYQNQIGRVSTKGVYQPAYTPDISFITDMLLGPDGNVWFAESGFSGDPGGQSIGRITPQGKVSLFPCGQRCTGQSLTVGPDGNIWFGGGTFIGRIDIKTGAMASFPIGAVAAVVDDLTVGADGNIWYTTNGLHIGRMTPSGVNTFFSVPVPNFSCGGGSIDTGPDHLLWITDATCGDVIALDVTGGQPSLVRSFSTGTRIDFLARGPDAVYFSFFGPGPVTIGRATTAGVTYYSTGASGFVQNLAAGPDGNIWFTDFVNNNGSTPGVGHVSPPPSGTTGAPAQGHLAPAATHANKAKPPKLATGSTNIRHPKPPPIAGDQCADVINPAQGTVINGDVTVNDNGFGCILSQVTINGNLHVSAGAFADLSFSTVNGSVTVDDGGQVHIVGSHVTGSVTGNGSSFVTMFNSKVDVNVTSNPSQYGVAMICGSTIGATLTDSGATDTTFPSVIGDPTGPIPCAKNTITGNLILSGNSEQILVHGNNVGGSIIVMNNPSTAAFDIRYNNANSLSCSGNAVAPTGGSNHGPATGQCAGL